MRRISQFIYPTILFILSASAIMVWIAVFHFEARRGVLSIRVFDVGQGDAIFIEAPDGNQILIDGGPDAAVLRRLGEIMLPWDRSIDAVILTHPHADHISGLIDVLRRYAVGRVIESGSEHSIAEYGEWRKEIERRGIPRTIAGRGQTITAGDLRLSILSPDEERMRSNEIHDAMVVLRLQFGSSTALFTGDMEKNIEYRLAVSGDELFADLLKIGHHGSKTSTSDFFLSRVRPRYAAISVGRKNRFGHPAAEVTERLAAHGIEIFRTDGSGTLTFVSDGQKFVPMR